MAPRRTAINPDERLSLPLGEITAADFLVALNSPSLDRYGLSLVADKKKYELWTDESGLPKLSIWELIERLRGEKKKLELEKMPLEYQVKKYREDFIDPREVLRDPVVIEEIAAKVAEKLGR